MSQAKDPAPETHNVSSSDRTRTIGLLAGGGALAVALAVVAFGADPDGRSGASGTVQSGATGSAAPENPVDSPPSHIAAPSGSAVAPVPKGPTADIAMAEGPRPPVSIPSKPAAPPKQTQRVENPDLQFLVRFDQRHPMYRAQQLFQQGRRVDAEAEARAILPLRPELRGLCFERFTLGAEIVFMACERAPKAQAQRVSDRLERRIRAIRGVEYVDANIVVHPEARAP